MRVIINGVSNKDPSGEWEWCIETREGGDYIDPALVKTIACGVAESFGEAVDLVKAAADRHFNLCARKKGT